MSKPFSQGFSRRVSRSPSPCEVSSGVSLWGFIADLPPRCFSPPRSFVVFRSMCPTSPKFRAGRRTIVLRCRRVKQCSEQVDAISQSQHSEFKHAAEETGPSSAEESA